MKNEEPLKDGGFNSGCLCCGKTPVQLHPSTRLSVGFGHIIVTKDGEVVWEGDDEKKTLKHIEKLAKKEPLRDWRILFNKPLSDEEYQRQSGKWVLVKKGKGFA